VKYYAPGFLKHDRQTGLFKYKIIIFTGQPTGKWQ
jgi:hypothetical protein